MNPQSAGHRLLSLDVFRGITLASMVLVNDPGTWQYIYPQLEHAEWHGWTFTDTVFPFFLWIAGVSFTLSLTKRVESGAGRKRLFWHILRRAAVIFAIGLFLNGFPYFPLDRIRYLGVLQRIAICYCIGGSLALVMKARGIIATIVALLTSYWLLMMLVPVPGCGAGHLDKDCNFSKYIDGLVLYGHMWSQTKTWDPEGIVSTIPAVATFLFGVLIGRLLRLNLTPPEKTAWTFGIGNALIFAGLVMSAWLPINKNLWTSSYSVFMAGLASVVLALCYWIVDVQKWRRWSRFFEIYGLNPLAVFIFTGIIGRLLGIIRIGDKPFEAWIFEHAFAPLASPINASLLYAVVNVLFYFAIVYAMYRRRWFLRI